MKRLASLPLRLYSAGRTWVFSRQGWQRFVEITKLPEMKISKTVGFILSILL